MVKRLTPHLRRMVIDLPVADRVELIEALRTSLMSPEHCGVQRLRYMAEKMKAISGKDVSVNSRDRRLVWARNIFIFVARREGFSQSDIGGFVGRDHSSVCAAEKRVNDMFACPECYEEEIRTYNLYTQSL